MMEKSSKHPLYPAWKHGDDVPNCECLKKELLGVWECDYRNNGETGVLLLKFDQNNEVTVCERYDRSHKDLNRYFPIYHDVKRDMYKIDCKTLYLANISYRTRLGTKAKFDIAREKITIETNYYSSMTQIVLRRKTAERFDEIIKEKRTMEKRLKKLECPKSLKTEEI